MKPPAPNTVPPSLAAKQSILQRARAAADAHGSNAEGGSPRKKVSSDWRDFFSKQEQVHTRGCRFNVYMAGDKGPVVFCLHGAGYTGLTFALVAEELSSDYRVVAMDQRHHGLTVADTDPGDTPDFSKNTLLQDAAEVWAKLFGEEQPPTVLLGHSFGGAIAVWSAKERPMPSLQGLIVIDVVEGTAIASLPSMTGILNQRPQNFTSPKEAITWVTEHNLSRSHRAASISVPSQLSKTADDTWEWRTPLLKSADRLDRPLTIAQMQGKFQALLVPNAGHAVHEDEAEEVAKGVRNFIQRFRIGLPPLEIPRATPGLAPILPQAIGTIHQAREGDTTRQIE